MDNIILKNITEALEKRYNQKLELTEILGGKDKYVYIAKNDNNKKFVILCDKRNSLMRSYRTIRSNYLQKELYQHLVKVAQVIDIFEEKGIGIIACHEYIAGKQVKSFTPEIAIQCGEIIAKLHNSKIKPKYFIKGFSYKYFIPSVIKFLTDNIRLIKSMFFDKSCSKLPTGICHRDLNLGNFIFMDKEAYLIDFDRHRIWPFAYEIRRFFIYEENRKFVKDFMIGYLSVRKINKNEQDFLLTTFPELKDIFNA